MSEFQPISTKADLDQQDETEMVSGYISGLNHEPEPGSNKSRSFWHGWRNGMADKGHLPHDPAMRQLAREIVGKYKGLH